jgi:benzoyl-CoA-dihydrodiol lyase
VAEGIRGRRAAEWNLVNAVHPKGRFDEAVEGELAELAAASKRDGSGLAVRLEPLEGTYEENWIEHRHVSAEIDSGARTATITVRAPGADEPTDPAAMLEAGSDLWALRAFRELDDILLHLRFNHETVGLMLLETEGDPEAVRRVDRALWEARPRDCFAREVLGQMKRTLKRLDQTARSAFAVIRPGSCFAGSLFELALASDRSYMLDDPDQPVQIGLSPLNFGAFPTSSGLSRLEVRFLGEPERLERARGLEGRLGPEEALDAGLVTFTPDDIDWEDELRIAVEERVSLSPDALTGMEANLRAPGPETMETKIFGRLSAWQNWIFTRPNSTGEKGALTLYGKPGRAEFDWRRT